MSRGRTVVPVIGARTRAQLEEALGALALSLSADDLARIEEAIPRGSAAGVRYASAQMRDLDSER